MLCFNYPEKESVGICKSCQRGLCFECAADLGHGLACKSKHETQVNTLETTINKSAKIYALAPQIRNLVPLLYGVVGIVVAGFALFKGYGITDLSFILGTGFIAFAIYIYVHNK